MCVGGKNYCAFLCYVCGCLFGSAWQIVAGIVYLVRWWGVLAANHNAYFRVGVIVMCAVALFGSAAMAFLLSFHIYLRLYLGMTTYQRLLQIRERTFTLEPRGGASVTKPPTKTTWCCSADAWAFFFLNDVVCSAYQTGWWWWLLRILWRRHPVWTEYGYWLHILRSLFFAPFFPFKLFSFLVLNVLFWNVELAKVFLLQCVYFSFC